MATEHNKTPINEFLLKSMKGHQVKLKLKKSPNSTPSFQLQYLKNQDTSQEQEKQSKKEQFYHYSLSGTHTPGFKPRMLRNNEEISNNVNYTGLLNNVTCTQRIDKVTGWIPWKEFDIPIYCLKIESGNEIFEFHFDEQFYFHFEPMEISHEDIDELMVAATEDGDE